MRKRAVAGLVGLAFALAGCDGDSGDNQAPYQTGGDIGAPEQVAPVQPEQPPVIVEQGGGPVVVVPTQPDTSPRIDTGNWDTYPRHQYEERHEGPGWGTVGAAGVGGYGLGRWHNPNTGTEQPPLSWQRRQQSRPLGEPPIAPDEEHRARSVLEQAQKGHTNVNTFLREQEKRRREAAKPSTGPSEAELAGRRMYEERKKAEAARAAAARAAESDRPTRSAPVQPAAQPQKWGGYGGPATTSGGPTRVTPSDDYKRVAPKPAAAGPIRRTTPPPAPASRLSSSSSSSGPKKKR